MTTKLMKDCPFCGGAPRLDSNHNVKVYCTNCLAEGAAVGMDEAESRTEAEHDAIMNWNMRTERTCYNNGCMCEYVDDVKVFYVQLTCGCNVATARIDGVTTFAPNYCPSCGAKVIER